MLMVALTRSMPPVLERVHYTNVSLPLMACPAFASGLFPRSGRDDNVLAAFRCL